MYLFSKISTSYPIQNVLTVGIMRWKTATILTNGFSRTLPKKLGYWAGAWTQDDAEEESLLSYY